MIQKAMGAMVLMPIRARLLLRFRILETEHLANLIADVLEAASDDKVIAKAAAQAKALCARFPVYEK